MDKKDEPWEGSWRLALASGRHQNPEVKRLDISRPIVESPDHQQGFTCSQILLMLRLEAQGKANPDLVRAMHAPAGGVGGCGDVCGTLTGGACLLGLYAGRGSAEEAEDPRLNQMIGELVAWFADRYGQLYGGVHCADILAGDPQNKLSRCPEVVASTYEMVKDLLVANGFDLAGRDA
jgi:C_GCAxxG_C_C family probable redox protein